MRILSLALALFACGARADEPVDSAPASLEAGDLQKSFEKWVAETKWKPGRGTSFQKAFKNFAANQLTLRALQLAEDESEGTAEFGNTIFSGMSSDEFAESRLMRADVSIDDSLQTHRVYTNGTVPDSWDWREHGAVTKVRDQGHCGSCWAFATAGALEGANFLTNEKELGKEEPTVLSVEQFAECDEHNYGCYGGWMDRAFQWAIEQGGVTTDEAYPYSRMMDKNPATKMPYVMCMANQTFNATCPPCEWDPPCTTYCDLSCEVDVGGKHPIHTKVVSYERLLQDEEEMKKYVATVGPLAITMNAIPLGLYKKGILSLSDRWCSPTLMNHAVLIVGYGSAEVKKGRFSKKTKMVDYWLIKNSWGEQWGEGGYFRMLRGKGTCGVHKYPVGVTVEKTGGDKKVMGQQTLVM